MNEILTPEMKELIKALGDLIKADPRCRAIEESIEDYERSEELNSMIAEYNAQQNLLADVCAKPDSDELRDTIQERIDQLYDDITSHPVYTAYLGAKGEFDELSNEVYAELQFVITGKRPCSHDCSSCGGHCH